MPTFQNYPFFFTESFWLRAWPECLQHYKEEQSRVYNTARHETAARNVAANLLLTYIY